jgi:hypothetical protein
MLCSIFRLDEEGLKSITCSDCGAAAYLRRPVFVSDIASDPRWAKFRDSQVAIILPPGIIEGDRDEVRLADSLVLKLIHFLAPQIAKVLVDAVVTQTWAATLATPTASRLVVARPGRTEKSASLALDFFVRPA